MTTDATTAQLETFLQTAALLRIEPHAVGSKVKILVGGYRFDGVGIVSDVRHGLHSLSMESGITLGGYTAWQLEEVK